MGTQLRLQTWRKRTWAPDKGSFLLHVSLDLSQKAENRVSCTFGLRPHEALTRHLTAEKPSISLHFFSSQFCFLQGSSPGVASPAVRRGPEEGPPSQRAHFQLIQGCYQPNLNSESPVSVGSPIGGAIDSLLGLPVSGRVSGGGL